MSDYLELPKTTDRITGQKYIRKNENLCKNLILHIFFFFDKNISLVNITV